MQQQQKRSRFQFAPAVRTQALARVVLDGPPGSGKTLTALKIASALGKRVAVIDTQRGRAAAYADTYGFDHLVLSTFAPMDLVEALACSAAEGHDVVVIDSSSSFWSGEEGHREQVDNTIKRLGPKADPNDAWREQRPHEHRMTKALLSFPGHVLATVRVRSEYVVTTNAAGGKERQLVGLKPDQREGFEYDWDMVGSMTPENHLVITKSLAPALTNQVIPQPGAEVGEQIRAWAEEGAPVGDSPQELVRKALHPETSFEELRAVHEGINAYGIGNAAIYDPDGNRAVLGPYVVQRGERAAQRQPQPA